MDTDKLFSGAGREIITPHGDAVIYTSTDIPTGYFPRLDSRNMEGYAEEILRRTHYEASRQDSSGSFAFARQLEHIISEVFEVEFAELRATDFIPLSTEVPAGSLTFTYRMIQKHGVAKVIAMPTQDAPAADVDAKEWPSPIVTTGSSYSYSVMETMRAALTNMPIETYKAEAARFAIEYLGEQIACFGLPNSGVPGLTTVPGMVATTQLSTGTWIAQLAAIASATASAPATAVAAAQGIAMDVQAMKAKIMKATFGLWTPDTVLLPTSLWCALDAIPRSPAFTDDTLLTFLEKISGMTFDHWPQLNDAGASGVGHGRVMVYKKDPRVVRLMRPAPFTQLPPQARSYAWIVPCFAQEGGVMAPQPLAITYMDGLDG